MSPDSSGKLPSSASRSSNQFSVASPTLALALTGWRHFLSWRSATAPCRTAALSSCRSWWTIRARTAGSNQGATARSTSARISSDARRMICRSCRRVSSVILAGMGLALHRLLLPCATDLERHNIASAVENLGAVGNPPSSREFARRRESAVSEGVTADRLSHVPSPPSPVATRRRMPVTRSASATLAASENTN